LEGTKEKKEGVQGVFPTGKKKSYSRKKRGKECGEAAWRSKEEDRVFYYPRGKGRGEKGK